MSPVVSARALPFLVNLKATCISADDSSPLYLGYEYLYNSHFDNPCKPAVFSKQAWLHQLESCVERNGQQTSRCARKGQLPSRSQPYLATRTYLSRKTGYLRCLFRTVRTLSLMSRDMKCGLLHEGVPVTPAQTGKRKAIRSLSFRTKARPVVKPVVADSAQEHIAHTPESQVQRERASGGEESGVPVLGIHEYDTKAEIDGCCQAQSCSSERQAWLVYLLLSCDRQKSYVGVTSDLLRRLKQHNGELHGGAKSCRAGRPWEVVCQVHGFSCKSDAFRFEYAWKAASRKVSRPPFVPGELSRLSSQLNLALVMRRHAALEMTVASMTFQKELQIDWQSPQNEKDCRHP